MTELSHAPPPVPSEPSAEVNSACVYPGWLKSEGRASWMSEKRRLCLRGRRERWPARGCVGARQLSLNRRKLGWAAVATRARMSSSWRGRGRGSCLWDIDARRAKAGEVGLSRTLWVWAI